MGIAVSSDPGSVKDLEEAPERVIGCSVSIQQAPKEGPGGNAGPLLLQRLFRDGWLRLCRSQEPLFPYFLERVP
jgi:hypothetical protein